MVHCHYCGKEFSTQSNRLRHERQYHEGEDIDDEESGSSDEMESEEVDSDYEQEAEQEEADLDDGDQEAQAWRSMLEYVYNDKRVEIPEDITATEVVNDEACLKAIMNHMAVRIGDWQGILHVLNEESETYRKLKKTQAKLIKTEDYSEDEAIQKSFKDRKGLIIDVIQENVGVLKDARDEDGTDDEDDTVIE